MNSSKIQDVYLTISIDTECDHDPNWVRSNPLTFDSLTEGLPNRLQPLFHDVGAIPTYLLTVEVLEDQASVDSLNSLQGKYEYGTHLHGAFIEPQKQYFDYAGIDSPDFQCNYPAEIEYQKLENLSKLFKEKLNRTPTSFRAGRFGAGTNTIASLKKLGYKVDSSVTPRSQWSEPNGCVDFRKAPLQPYWPSLQNLSKEALSHENDDILEVPVSVKNRLFRSQPHWFRPWFSNVDNMKLIYQHHLKKNSQSKVVVLNMMFHSMEVIEKASPYPQSADDLKRYLDDTHEILRWCGNEGVKFAGLSDLHDIYK